MSRAYGWNWDGTVVDDEATQLRRMADHILAGGSIAKLAITLRDDGIPTSTGTDWSRRAITRALANPRIAGLKETAPGVYTEHPSAAPILPRETWDALIALLGDESRQRFNRHLHQDVPTDPLLGGLLYCVGCGNNLYQQRTSYACSTPGCRKVKINRNAVDTEVGERVLTRVTSGPWLRAIGDAYRRGPGFYDDEVRAVEDREVVLAEAFGSGGNRAAFDAGIAAAGRAKDDAQRFGDVARVVPDPTPAAIVEWWVDATPEARRALIRLVVERITVNPSRKGTTTADRLDWVWRD